jgi:aminoglycoside phosphotransferase family enzyme/predicted kinase
MSARRALDEHEALIAALLRPAAYPEPVGRVERIDTHISTVLLAGGFAYKIKKPVDLGFLDFTSLERRRLFCAEEVRLNRRTAPQVYLDVVPVTGPLEAARFGVRSATPAAHDGGDDDRGTRRAAAAGAAGDDATVDYAVRMRRFDDAWLLDRLAQRGALSASQVDRLAAAVARFHQSAQRSPAGFGTPEVAARWARENIASMREQVLSPAGRARLDALAAWTDAEVRVRQPLMAARVDAGFVRECHGDLHLGNIVLLDGEPVAFDGIEFNAELRHIDVVSDIAFTFMDLLDHGLAPLAWRFLNTYLEHSGDYDGLALLRFYAVYRALVRAKVALIRLQQPQVPQHARLRSHASFEHYLALAERLRQPAAPLLVVMTGLSGAGKSTVAGHLAEGIGGARVRSDIERKRLFGLGALDASGGTIYGAQATARTYDRLAELARTVVQGGFPVLVDAAFLRRDERLRFRALAAALGARHVLVSCEAPADVLRQRIAERAARGADPSEATVEVLERQIGWREVPGDDERDTAVFIDTARDPAAVARASAALAATLLA